MPLNSSCGGKWVEYISSFLNTKSSKYFEYFSVRVKVVTYLLILEHFRSGHPSPAIPSRLMLSAWMLTKNTRLSGDSFHPSFTVYNLLQLHCNPINVKYGKYLRYSLAITRSSGGHVERVEGGAWSCVYVTSPNHYMCESSSFFFLILI